MAVFEMLVNPPEHLLSEGYIINNKYFSVDTASVDTVDEWLACNGHIVTYTMLDGKVIGFYNLMPLTEECGKLFERQAIKEEDLRPEHMLPHESLPFAQYAYLAGIAVRDTRDYTNRQAVAAMLSAIASHLLYGYDARYLKKLFANPTTFQGNHMVRRLGLRPINADKKHLGENDIYAADINADARGVLAELESRYARFVRANSWRKSAI